MNKPSLFFSFLLLCSILLSCAQKDTRVHDTQNTTEKKMNEKITTDSESIGKYTAGCIKDPARLPFSGNGYQVIRHHRQRYYGHSKMIQFLRDLSARLNRKYKTTLYIADISKYNGGPILDDHSSHQIGLDADILYIHKPLGENKKLSPGERENKYPETTLLDNEKYVDPGKWSPVNENILMETSGSRKVDRIFVNPAIKRKLCEKYPGEDWLRKIRPWWGHDGHFHVRLKCPENSPSCVSGPHIPSGTGCGSDLAWWFSEDARRKRIELSKAPSKTEDDIVLPEDCENILK